MTAKTIKNNQKQEKWTTANLKLQFLELGESEINKQKIEIIILNCQTVFYNSFSFKYIFPGKLKSKIYNLF